MTLEQRWKSMKSIHAVPGSLGQLCVPTTRKLHDLEDKSFREDLEWITSARSRLGIVLICKYDISKRFYDIQIDCQVLSQPKTLWLSTIICILSEILIYWGQVEMRFTLFLIYCKFLSGNFSWYFRKHELNKAPQSWIAREKTQTAELFSITRMVIADAVGFWLAKRQSSNCCWLVWESLASTRLYRLA